MKIIEENKVPPNAKLSPCESCSNFLLSWGSVVSQWQEELTGFEPHLKDPEWQAKQPLNQINYETSQRLMSSTSVTTVV